MLHGVTSLGVIAVLSWCGGFLWFQVETHRLPPPPPSHVDGIVALTGGAGRIPLALRVLAERGAARLLITGIGGNAEPEALAHTAGVDPAAMAERITLGHYAASTRGNAVETAAWATQNNIRSLIVVTASWHMPRALAELRIALPETALYPLPVAPDEADQHSSMQSLRLRAEEYTKYLLVAAGLSGWFPRRETMSAPHPEAVTATPERG